MKQRYFCKNCKTTKVEFYTYKAYKQEIDQNIVALTKEGVGILGTARLLAISPTTLLKRIKEIASNITQPAISKNKTYEIDEMRTFIGNKNKLIWIVYALTTKQYGFIVAAVAYGIVYVKSFLHWRKDA
jgi:hypothetical protein